MHISSAIKDVCLTHIHIYFHTLTPSHSSQTNMPHLPQLYMEVHRSQSDFQWLYDALQEACPERIVPPLKPPISLDATMSEFQRFLTRMSAHKVLRKNHLFIMFLTGTAEVNSCISMPLAIKFYYMHFTRTCTCTSRCIEHET